MRGGLPCHGVRLLGQVGPPRRAATHVRRGARRGQGGQHRTCGAAAGHGGPRISFRTRATAREGDVSLHRALERIPLCRRARFQARPRPHQRPCAWGICVQLGGIRPLVYRRVHLHTAGRGIRAGRCASFRAALPPGKSARRKGRTRFCRVHHAFKRLRGTHESRIVAGICHAPACGAQRKLARAVHGGVGGRVRHPSCDSGAQCRLPAQSAGKARCVRRLALYVEGPAPAGRLL